MKKVIAIFWWPVSLIYAWSIIIRKSMFTIGKWKSVEFEWPTVGLYSLNGDVDMHALQSLIALCQENAIKAVGLVEMLAMRNQNITCENIDGSNYLYKLKKISNIFSTRQSRVLGVSELYRMNANYDVLIVQESKFHTEIRKDLSIVLIPPIENNEDLKGWPLGISRHLASDWQSCELIADAELLLVDDNRRQSLDYSSEGIDIISDRDTFERSFIENLKEVIRKKQSVD